MKCRQCQSFESKVLESRETRKSTAIRRRRECMSCGYRFTTFETYGEQPISVLKRDGTRQLFSREKLLRSITLACQKSKISTNDLDQIVDWVESQLTIIEDHEITSQKIGEWVLAALYKLDPVAYVRFASVYRAFSSLEDFVNELSQLTQKSAKCTPS